MIGRRRRSEDPVPGWQRDQEDREPRGRAEHAQREHRREAAAAARAKRKAGRDERRQARRARRAARPGPAGAMPASLRIPRRAALVTIAAVIAAASLTSFAESYRGLYDWAREHGLSGLWAAVWPLQLDTFIAVGELALFVALADRWAARSRAGAWAVTLLGLAASVAGNVGHVQSHLMSYRATAAVPPLAAAAALAVGLGVLKRVVQAHAGNAAGATAATEPGAVPSSVLEAARTSMAATVAAGNPWSVNQLQQQFSLTRAQATKLRSAVLGETNGHASHVEAETPAAPTP